MSKYSLSVNCSYHNKYISIFMSPIMDQYSDVIISTIKSTASRLFPQSFAQAQIKENIKAPRHWPLWGESTGDRHMDTPHKGPVTRKMFPFDDIIMTICCSSSLFKCHQQNIYTIYTHITDIHQMYCCQSVKIYEALPLVKVPVRVREYLHAIIIVLVGMNA